MPTETKRMTFGAIMARGEYPVIELIDGSYARIEGYGQDAATGHYWMQWAGILGNWNRWNRIDNLDPSAELKIIPENWVS